MVSKLLSVTSLFFALAAAGSSQCRDAPYDGYLALSDYGDAVAYCTAKYPVSGMAEGHDRLVKKGAPKCRKRYVKSESELKELWSECRGHDDEFVEVVCGCIVPKNPKPWTTTSGFTTPANNYVTSTTSSVTSGSTTSETITTSSSESTSSSSTTTESSSSSSTSTSSSATTTTSSSTTSSSSSSTPTSTTTTTTTTTSSSSTATSTTSSSSSSSSSTSTTTSSSFTTTSSSSSTSSSSTTTITTTSSTSSTTTSSSTTTTSASAPRCTNGIVQAGANCYQVMCNTTGSSNAPYGSGPATSTNACLSLCALDPTRCTLADFVISNNLCLLYDSDFSGPTPDGNNDIILKVTCAV